MTLAYSWHQSHDEATILIVVHDDSTVEDLIVVIDEKYLLAGFRGSELIVKGLLYGNVNTDQSSWQLEPQRGQISRERTTSTFSNMSTSTRSSFAYVSDAEISGSIATSFADDSEYTQAYPSVYAGPSRPTSSITVPPSMVSSGSSFQSSGPENGQLQLKNGGRLLTIHLEKVKPEIWPTLVKGPVDSSLSPCFIDPFEIKDQSEDNSTYNMDPTSIAFVAFEMIDVKNESEKGFEYLVRAWHQAHAPSVTLRLCERYFPLPSAAASTEMNDEETVYIRRLGGFKGLAELYKEAGAIYLQGIANLIRHSSHSRLDSIRVHSSIPSGPQLTSKFDLDMTARYFEHAQFYNPSMVLPPIPADIDTPISTNAESPALEMPAAKRDNVDSVRWSPYVDEALQADESWIWSMSSLLGTGAAIVAVMAVGFLSVNTWRKNQSS